MTHLRRLLAWLRRPTPESDWTLRPAAVDTVRAAPNRYTDTLARLRAAGF